MHKVNRKIEYALMALKFMSGKMPGQLTQVKEICEKTGSPFDATASYAADGPCRSFKNLFKALMADTLLLKIYQK